MLNYQRVKTHFSVGFLCRTMAFSWWIMKPSPLPEPMGGIKARLERLRLIWGSCYWPWTTKRDDHLGSNDLGAQNPWSKNIHHIHISWEKSGFWPPIFRFEVCGYVAQLHWVSIPGRKHRQETQERFHFQHARSVLSGLSYDKLPDHGTSAERLGLRLELLTAPHFYLEDTFWFIRAPSFK